MRQELMNNLSEAVSANGISDLAHVEAVPYVDAVTMDRNTASHCRSVVRRLNKSNSGIKYEQRLFTGLEDLLNAQV